MKFLAKYLITLALILNTVPVAFSCAPTIEGNVRVPINTLEIHFTLQIMLSDYFLVNWDTVHHCFLGEINSTQDQEMDFSKLASEKTCDLNPNNTETCFDPCHLCSVAASHLSSKYRIWCYFIVHKCVNTVFPVVKDDTKTWTFGCDPRDRGDELNVTGGSHCEVIPNSDNLFDLECLCAFNECNGADFVNEKVMPLLVGTVHHGN